MFGILRRPSIAPAIACLRVIAAVVLTTTIAQAQTSVLSVSTPVGWNGISLPYEPVNGDPYDIFDELRPPTESFDLLSGSLHRYDNASSSYVTYRTERPSAFGPAVHGEGYWLWMAEATVIRYESVVPSSVPRITLNGAGWHMIGLPRAGTFPLSDILVTNVGTGQSKLLAEAVAAGLVQLPIHRIDRGDADGSGVTYTSLPAPGQPLTDVALSAYDAHWIHRSIDDLIFTFDSPPTNLAAQATSDTQVSLTWSDNSEYDTGYEVERRIAPASFQRIAALPANTKAYTDSTVSPGTTYEYHVRGRNAVGTTAYSNAVSVTTPEEPQTPVPVGTVLDVVTDGSCAFVGSVEHGIVVVDVGNPASPKGIGATGVGFTPYHLDRDGSLVVAAGGQKGIAIVDVRDPTNPIWVSSLSVPATEVAVQGTYAFVVDGAGGLRVVDMRHPSQPVVAGELPLSGTPSEIAVVGRYAYVASGGEMQVIDVSLSDAPRLAGTLPVSCQRVTAGEAYAYVDGLEYGGIQVVDVGNPAKPTVVGQHQTGNVLERFVVQGDKIYAGYRAFYGTASGLRIVDVANPAGPFTTAGVRTDGYATGVAAYGTWVYLSAGAAGLQVIDVSDPYKPVIVGNAQ